MLRRMPFDALHLHGVSPSRQTFLARLLLPRLDALLKMREVAREQSGTFTSRRKHQRSLILEEWL